MWVLVELHGPIVRSFYRSIFFVVISDYGGDCEEQIVIVVVDGLGRDNPWFGFRYFIVLLAQSIIFVGLCDVSKCRNDEIRNTV